MEDLRNIWTLQVVGLWIVTFTSFFPALNQIQIYAMFTLMALAGVAAWRHQIPMWTSTILDTPLLLFLGWVVFTVPFAIDPSYSFTEWRKLTAKILVFYWALLVIRASGNPIMVCRGLFTSVTIAASLLSGYGLMEFWQRGGSWEHRLVRASAPNSDPNWLSTYLVIALPVMTAYSASLNLRLGRITTRLGMALALLTVIAAYVRAAWVSIGAEILAYGIWTARRLIIAGVLAGGVALWVGLYALSEAGYQQDTFDSWTEEARLKVWTIGLSEILVHPIVGQGFGNNTFAMRFPDLAKEPGLSHLHNTFLMIAFGSGIPALALFTWILFTIVRHAVRVSSEAREHERRLQALSVGIMVIGFSVKNGFDYMMAGSLGYLFWLVVATLVGSNPGGTTHNRPNLCNPTKLPYNH